MIALVASFFSLFVGPLVYQTFGPLKRTDKIVSGIVLIIVSGVIFFEIMPLLFDEIGFIAIIFLLLGFAGPNFIESTFKKAADTTHKLTIYLGLTGLLVHGLIDGAAIQSEELSSSHNFTLAILLHRLPVGLTIWWLLKPILGERAALIMLFLMGITTISGYFLSQMVSNIIEHSFISCIQAFVAGSLLHVVIYKPHADGCLHTSNSHHQHENTSSSNKKNNSQGIIFKFLSQLGKLRIKFSRWDIIGYTLGLILLFIIHSTAH